MNNAFERLNITNFQSWANGSFDFHPGVNVIIGSSRNGKSAVLRALRLVCENKPAGDRCRRWDTKETSVGLVLGDGTEVTRYKTASKNTYTVVPADEDEPDLLLKAFGQGLPDAVGAVLNLDSEITFQWQHDIPFMLGDSPPQVARRLNRVAKLDLIDKALSNIDSMKRENKREEVTAKSTVEKLETELADFAYLAGARKKYTQLENDHKQLTKASTDANRLGSLLDALDAAKLELLQYADNEAAEALDRVSEVAETLIETQKRMDNVRRLGALIKQEQVVLDEATEKLTHSEQLKRIEQALTTMSQKSKLADVIESFLTGHDEETRRVTLAETILAHSEQLTQIEQVLKVRAGKASAADTLEVLLTGYNEAARCVMLAETVSEDATAEWKLIAPESCPLCGNEMAIAQDSPEAIGTSTDNLTRKPAGGRRRRVPAPL